MYAFDIFLLLILASFDSHDMKPIHSVNYCILSLIFRHSRHSFAFNFLNNGPIFNPIEPLELSQCPLAFDGIYYHVYMIYTSVEIYDTKYTSIDGKQVLSVETYVRTI